MLISSCLACVRAGVKRSAALVVPVRHAWVRLATGLALVILVSWLVYTGYSEWQKTTGASSPAAEALMVEQSR
jgi:hypothetical protein